MGRKRIQLSPSIQRSKPMDWRWVEYSYCQYIVQKYEIKSARGYWKWYTEYSPAGFPLRPERIYAEWVNWNSFLGGDNTYLADHPIAVREADLMEYWEACNLIQSMRLETVEEYCEAFDAGNIPAGIPRRPHLRYPIFYKYGGYKNWLGKNIKHRVEAAKNIDPLLVVYQAGQQPNVLSILIHTTGITSLMNELRDKQIKVVKVYHWYPEFAEHVFDMLDAYGTKQGDTTWLFSNVHEILFELGSVLEVYRV